MIVLYPPVRNASEASNPSNGDSGAASNPSNEDSGEAGNPSNGDSGEASNPSQIIIQIRLNALFKNHLIIYHPSVILLDKSLNLPFEQSLDLRVFPRQIIFHSPVSRQVIQ